MTTNNHKFPPGFDEAKIKSIIEHYENQTEDEAVAEDETIITGKQQTMMQIPNKLVPVVRELIAKNQA
ncbi:conserved hypothetical protein [Hyella patelloides LEGE 07179]|uniref:Uncharacterized protein n=1 Tax=Hyella patelloides LEGE 07179 TaxID=945734 RepID=A0A563W0C3_9CYAN|nr:hypothetical protein [Hyella patelloides]VEP17162.1 conserved hypothetical protein [Hyella patelloides LEGE 07179]